MRQPDRSGVQRCSDSGAGAARGADALRGGVLLGSGRGGGARAAGAGLVLRVGSILTLGLGCAVCGYGGALWPFWAGCAVFLRFGLNSSIENLRIVVFPGLVPAICRYRNPSKAVAIYVF